MRYTWRQKTDRTAQNPKKTLPPNPEVRPWIRAASCSLHSESHGPCTPENEEKSIITSKSNTERQISLHRETLQPLHIKKRWMMRRKREQLHYMNIRHRPQCRAPFQMRAPYSPKERSPHSETRPVHCPRWRSATRKGLMTVLTPPSTNSTIYRNTKISPYSTPLVPSNREITNPKINNPPPLTLYVPTNAWMSFCGFSA